MTETTEQRRAQVAEYVKKNRNQWANAGFTGVNTKAHSDDRPVLLAYADLLRYERILHSVLADDVETMHFAAGRNMAKAPSFADFDELTQRIEKLTPTKAAQVRGLVAKSRTYNKKMREAKQRLNADPLSLKEDALMRAYSCAQSSVVKYAQAIARHGLPDADEVDEETLDTLTEGNNADV